MSKLKEILRKQNITVGSTIFAFAFIGIVFVFFEGVRTYVPTPPIPVVVKFVGEKLTVHDQFVELDVAGYKLLDCVILPNSATGYFKRTGDELYQSAQFEFLRRPGESRKYISREAGKEPIDFGYWRWIPRDADGVLLYTENIEKVMVAVIHSCPYNAGRPQNEQEKDFPPELRLLPIHFVLKDSIEIEDLRRKPEL